MMQDSEQHVVLPDTTAYMVIHGHILAKVAKENYCGLWNYTVADHLDYLLESQL